MNQVTGFRNSIIVHGLLVAIAAEVASLFFVGFDWSFTFALAVGTVIAIGNFLIMEFCAKLALDKGNPLVTIAGYIARFALYGGGFYLTVTTSYKMGLACAIGFFTIQIAIFYLFAVKPSFTKKNKDKESQISEEDSGNKNVEQNNNNE